MRDIAITIIVFGLVLWALKRPHIGVLSWTWLSMMNPHRLAYLFAYSLPFAQIIAVATFIGMFFSKEKYRLPLNGTVLVLTVFILWMCITTLASENYDVSTPRLWLVLKILLMIYVALMVLRTEQHINL